MNHRNIQTVFLGLLCLIAVFAAMWTAKGFFAPVVAAMVLGVVAAPLADRIEAIGLPRAAASFVILVFFAALSASIFAALEPTVTRAIRNGPMIWRELTETIEVVRGIIAGAREMQESVGEALNEGSGGGGDDGAASAEEAPVPVPGLLEALAYAPSIAASFMIFLGTFYFYLIGRSDLYERIDKSPINLSREILCRAETRVSKYFLTITLINGTFGIIVGAAMLALGMPQPLMWGIAAFLVNFVLYLGPASLAVALLITGLVAFDGFWSFVPPVIYLSMNMIEGQFVTPAMVGRHMKVNPLLVFISLVFWLWLWGPIGGLVAIPVLVWTLFILGRLGEEAVEQPNAAHVGGLTGCEDRDTGSDAAMRASA